MADQEHLQELRKGVTHWNQWRRGLVYPDLAVANLSGINLSRADFSGANLIGVDLIEANFVGANLIATNLSKATLNNAKFFKADLSGANLADANLSGANFFGAKLNRANLRRANLRDATFIDANLRGADLGGVDLSRATMGRTILGEMDLQTVKGLDTVRHVGPSTLGMDTIVLSQGTLPLVFLRGVGIPEIIIDYLPSLLTTPLQYYSCFISYASQDEQFVTRLHHDLQQSGIRCWFAPHNLKPGDDLLERIDEAIQFYDKLLLVLSEHSVQSNWVRYEVKQAIARENEQGSTILFPIHVDDAVLHGLSGWATSLRRTRHLGNFTGWNDPVI